MLVVILLVAVVAVTAAAGVVVWIRRAVSCARIIGAPDGEPAQVFTGDVMSRYALTSGYFARLEVHDWGVRIRGVAATRWFVPTWEARYEELAMVELVASRSRIAVWLRIRGESGGIGFLTSRSQEILRQLEQHDVQVSRAAAQVKRVTELYPPS